MALLLAIFACCMAGVTVLRGERAWRLIFSTLWFNGLLVLLVVNVAFCFFGRIWGRKMTLVSFGMILFHLSFVSIFAGVVYNSLFYFHGNIRLSEGEVLPSADPQSYDAVDHGRFFKYSRLEGETTLVKMHRGYRVGSEDKVVAYEVAVGEGRYAKQGIIYATKNLNQNGFRYFREKEGYTVLVVLYDTSGNELYGAFVPLQSFKQKDGTYLYATGTKEEGPGSFPFPALPEEPLYYLQAAYVPSNFVERGGEASLSIWPVNPQGALHGDPMKEGKTAVGEKLYLLDGRFLSVKEVRYWVGMDVKYDPGLAVVLSSLWSGLGGMVVTFIGRLRRRGTA